MAEWYTRVAGNVTGPHSVDTLLAMASSGRLSPADEVLKGPDGAWTAARHVRGLAFTTARQDADDAAMEVLTGRDADHPVSVSMGTPTAGPARVTYHCPDASTEAAENLLWYAGAFRIVSLVLVVSAIVAFIVATQNVPIAWLIALTLAGEAFASFAVSCLFAGFADLVNDSRRQVSILVELVNRTGNP